MLQISFIILLQIPLNIYLLCSILFFYAAPSITILYLQFIYQSKVSFHVSSKLAMYLYAAMFAAVPTPTYSISSKCSHDLHNFGYAYCASEHLTL